MNKYLFRIFCVYFKLLKLNFLEYCIFDTMHYFIYDNFDQASDFWESSIHEDVGKLFRGNSEQKRIIQLLIPRAFVWFFSDFEI